MYVCMYVRNGFTTETCGFMHSLHTSLARAAHDAIAMEVDVKDRRIENDARTSPDVWKTFNCSTKG